jgi:hypothetical protein
MNHQTCSVFCRTVLVGAALMALASVPACNNKGDGGQIDATSTEKQPSDDSASSSTPIDPGAVGAERTISVPLVPCTTNHSKPCAKAAQPVKSLTTKEGRRPVRKAGK